MDQILFIRLRLLGDIIFTIPALEIFKRRYPETRITYVVEERFREIATLIPHIDKLMVLPRKMNLGQHFAFRKEVKGMGIDTVVDFHSGPKSALLTRICGAKKRIGYRTANRNWAYTHMTPRTFGSGFTHSVFNQVKLLEHLGIGCEDIPDYPEIPVDETAVGDHVKKELAKTGGGKKVVLHVGAGNAFRDWGFDNFSALLARLETDGTAVFLVGHGPAETAKAIHLSQRHKVMNMTSRLSIAETFYLISQCDVYVGVDSGPLHLASLTSTPLVALYGPNLPQVSGPWRQKNVSILQLPLPCRPCSQRTCIHDTIRCMVEIKPEDVYETIIRYL